MEAYLRLESVSNIETRAGYGMNTIDSHTDFKLQSYTIEEVRDIAEEMDLPDWNILLIHKEKG